MAAPAAPQLQGHATGSLPLSRSQLSLDEQMGLFREIKDEGCYLAFNFSQDCSDFPFLLLTCSELPLLRGASWGSATTTGKKHGQFLLTQKLAEAVLKLM